MVVKNARMEQQTAVSVDFSSLTISKFSVRHRNRHKSKLLRSHKSQHINDESV